MIELTKDNGWVAVTSAQDGDKFLVTGREMLFGVSEAGRGWQGGVYLYTTAPGDDEEYVRPIGMNRALLTRQEMQGVLMSGFFDLRYEATPREGG